MGGLREKVVDNPSYGAPYKERVAAPRSSAQQPNSLYSIIDKIWNALFGKKQQEWNYTPGPSTAPLVSDEQTKLDPATLKMLQMEQARKNPSSPYYDPEYTKKKILGK